MFEEVWLREVLFGMDLPKYVLTNAGMEDGTNDRELGMQRGEACTTSLCLSVHASVLVHSAATPLLQGRSVV